MLPMSVMRGLAQRCLVALAFGCCAAQAAPAAHALTEADLTSYLDGYVPVEMARAGIAGFGIAVVKDGRVLLARGYGMADRASTRPVSAQDTLFRIGSVSKLFGWMAVMQLQEQGKLDLDADVQRYLDFALRSPELGPITMRQLMTHRAGFEESIAGLWASPGEDMELRHYLLQHQPARIHAPGTVPAYSNYGATLAAYVVQRLSGQPFERYVKQHLLQPLGMAHTSFAQPLPAALKPFMSSGYENASGAAREFELIRVAPAGAASASVADMARFMLAQLGGGDLDGQRVLRPESMAAMLAPQWRHHAQGPALGLGYYEEDGFGQRVIGHGGDTQWFHSGMYLLPEQGMGIFITQNSLGERSLRGELLRRLLERYYPPVAVAAAVSAPDVSVAGRYRSSRRIDTGPLRMAGWLGQTQISLDAEGRLLSSSQRGTDEQPLRFRALGQGVWQAEAQDPAGPGRRLFFRRGEASGRWEMSGRAAVQIEQQLPWWEDGRLLLALVASALGLAGLSLLSWPLAARARRHYRQARPEPRLQRARQALRAASALLLTPWLALALLALPGLGDMAYLSGRVFGLGLRGVQVLGWLLLPALWLALRGAALQWRTPGSWWWARLHAALMVLACFVALGLGCWGQILLGS